jgi:hypothetical protein
VVERWPWGDLHLYICCLEGAAGNAWGEEVGRGDEAGDHKCHCRKESEDILDSDE